MSPLAESYAPALAFLEKHAPTLAERAGARIEASEPDYGASYVWTSRRHLVAELAEEVDTAAWSALIAHRVVRDELGGRERAVALLAAISQRAAEADVLVTELARLMEAVHLPPAGDA